jgi:hypothetical protein
MFAVPLLILTVLFYIFPLNRSTPLSDVLNSYSPSKDSLWALYDAEELAATHHDGDEVNALTDLAGYVWADHSLKKPAARTDSQQTTFVKSGVGGLPSLKIHGSHLCTNSEVDTPQSGSVTAIISFRRTAMNTFLSDQDTEWYYFIGQGHDTHWQVRSADTLSNVGLCVGSPDDNYSTRCGIENNEDYVGVFRFNQATQETNDNVYNYRNKALYSSRASLDFNRDLNTGSQAKICIGWSDQAKASNRMYGYIRQVAVYNSYLDDNTVNRIRRLFFEQLPVGANDDLIPYSGSIKLKRDYFFYNHVTITSNLIIQGVPSAGKLTTLHQKSPQRLFEIQSDATLTLKQVKIKGGSGTFDKKKIISTALGYWDFTVSMKDKAGKVGDMRFVKGSASIGDGGADGEGLRLTAPNDAVKTRFLASRKLPIRKTLVAWVTLEDLNVTGGAVISIINEAEKFTALVFAENQAGKWIVGSDWHKRTKNVAPSQETNAGEKIFIAATFDEQLKNNNVVIQMYRNGVKYGEPYRKNKNNQYLHAQTQIFEAGTWGVLIGPRHGTSGAIDATVHQIGVWDRALSEYEIATLYGKYTSPGGILITQGSLNIINSVLTGYGWKGMVDGRYIFDRANDQTVTIENSVLSYGFGETKWGNFYDGKRGCAGAYINLYLSSSEQWEITELATVNDHYCF